MPFTATARAARDAAFAHLGQWVAVYSAARGRSECRAMLASQSVTEAMGAIALAQNGRYLRFRAEDAPLRGEIVAILDGPAGAETDRRRVTGAPLFVDGRRLVVECDTAPE